MIPQIGNSMLAMVGNRNLKEALVKTIRRCDIEKNLSKTNQKQMNWRTFKVSKTEIH